MKVGFYANSSKPRAMAAVDGLAAAARRHGLGVSGLDEAEVVIALGGDGTMLRAVHECPTKPILGFNLGGLGYLSGVGESEFDNALDELANGGYRVSERSMLSVRKSGSEATRAVALNDVVVTREMSGHAACLDLRVDGRLATRYLADGLIFATPTGSTAYSLAAGGPVLMPDTCCVVITPMNPHALGVRPMAVKDSSNFAVSLDTRSGGVAEKAGVYADGENVFSMEPGESLEVEKAERGAMLVELNGYDPYEVLARKLFTCRSSRFPEVLFGAGGIGGSRVSSR